MNEINRVLSRAAWRMGFGNFLKGLVVALGALLAAAIVLRVVEQVLGFTVAQASTGPRPEGARPEVVSRVMWEMVGYWGVGAAVAGGIVWAIVRRPRPLAVARRVDEGANLKESLSTALCVAKQDDPWSRATVESASRTARGVNVAAAVPIQPPRFWPVVVALGLSLGIVWVALPKLDVMGWFATAEAEKKKDVEIVNAKRDVEEVKKKIEEMTAKIPSLEKEKGAETPPADKPEPKTAEEIRKAMVSQLAKKAEQLEDLKNGVQAQKLEAMQAQLKQLKQPGQETSDLAKALAKADFKAAKAELEKVKDKLSGDSKLSAEDKEKLAAQLEKMAQQMKELANNQEAMEKALKEAGIPKEALASKEALQKAIEKSENLSQEQKEALQKMAEGGMECKDGMAAMAEAMDKMSKSGKSGDGQQSAEGAKGMSDQLSEMEDLKQEMAMAEAAMSECKSAMAKMGKDGNCDGMGECNGNGNGNGNGMGPEGTKPWAAGWNQSQGNGRGGAGLGQGGRPGEAKADFALEKKKSIGAKGDGPIVSTKLVEGESVRGESKAEFARVVASGEQNATEAIENNLIPREYHDAIKGYFGRLKGKTGNGAPAGGGEAEKKKDEPAAAPAEDAGKK